MNRNATSFLPCDLLQVIEKAGHVLKTPMPSTSAVNQQNNNSYDNTPFYRQQAWMIVKVGFILEVFRVVSSSHFLEAGQSYVDDILSLWFMWYVLRLSNFRDACWMLL